MFSCWRFCRQFSSFNGGEAPPYPGPPPGPPPAYFAPRGGEPPHPGDGYSPVGHPVYGPPPPLPPPPVLPPHTSSASLSLTPPASGHLVDLSHAHVSSAMQNAPLNLSLSSSPTPVSLATLATTRQGPRPSVITCMSSSSSSSSSTSPVSSGGSSPHAAAQNGHHGGGGHSNNNGHHGGSPPNGSSPPGKIVIIIICNIGFHGVLNLIFVCFIA